MTKSLFVMITGRPNAGKSTLLNALLGEKVAIVSSKPQTTRCNITGVLTEGEDQFVFVDTPGLHKPRTLLGEYMMKSVGNASDGADVILFVTEACRRLNPAERNSLRHYSDSGVPLFLIINKVDLADKGELAAYISDISSEYRFDSVIPISALKKDGTDIIMSELRPHLVESPHFFPDDIFTDQPEKQLFAEIIREKVLRLIEDEIPHGVAVAIEELKDENDLISVRAEIYCEKESHKRIIIGKGGEMLKKIGTYAREDAEQLFGAKVFLDLWVRVKENWRDNRALLCNFGYNGDEK